MFIQISSSKYWNSKSIYFWIFPTKINKFLNFLCVNDFSFIFYKLVESVDDRAFKKPKLSKEEDDEEHVDRSAKSDVKQKIKNRRQSVAV